MNYIYGEIEKISTHIEAEHLADHMGEEVIIHGVIYKIRQMSGFAFVLLQTKRKMVQCVWSEEFSSFPLSDLMCNMSVIYRGGCVRLRSTTGI